MCRCGASTENARHRRKLEAGQRRVKAAGEQYAADVLRCAMCAGNGLRQTFLAAPPGRVKPRVALGETAERLRSTGSAIGLPRRSRSGQLSGRGATGERIHHHPPREAEARPQAPAVRWRQHSSRSPRSKLYGGAAAGPGRTRPSRLRAPTVRPGPIRLRSPVASGCRRSTRPPASTPGPRPGGSPPRQPNTNPPRGGVQLFQAVLRHGQDHLTDDAEILLERQMIERGRARRRRLADRRPGRPAGPPHRPGPRPALPHPQPSPPPGRSPPRPARRGGLQLRPGSAPPDGRPAPRVPPPRCPGEH